ncbi:hypothetical protein Fcan01_27869 [Folsomia candida]|uniref:Uncharacterized protein n=1 Tax=Folsomia candida TaxID=158441 RepID=A0A226CWK7_FOLCA|nr:hypothetical protein Fcan01_27869 [Folsomia candida]
MEDERFPCGVVSAAGCLVGETEEEAPWVGYFVEEPGEEASWVGFLVPETREGRVRGAAGGDPFGDPRVRGWGSGGEKVPDGRLSEAETEVASPALVVRGWPNRIASREVGTSEVRRTSTSGVGLGERVGPWPNGRSPVRAKWKMQCGGGSIRPNLGRLCPQMTRTGPCGSRVSGGRRRTPVVGELSPGGNDPETDVRSDRRRGMVPIRVRTTLFVGAATSSSARRGGTTISGRVTASVAALRATAV